METSRCAGEFILALAVSLIFEWLILAENQEADRDGRRGLRY